MTSSTNRRLPLLERVAQGVPQQDLVSRSMRNQRTSLRYKLLLNLGVGLLGCRTVDQKDYWAVGLMICSTAGLWNC